MHAFARWWRWGIASGIIVFTIGSTGIGFLARGPEFASWIVTILSALTVVGAVAGWASNGSKPKPAGTTEQLLRAADLLRKRIERHWRAESARQELDKPYPLRTLWELLGSPGDDADATIQLPPTSDTWEIVAALRTSQQPRLVVTGEPGSGKSILAIQLCLELCATGSATDPVPVILPLSDWNPGAASLLDWAVARLVDDYGFLRDEETFGADAAGELVANRRILLVLDGLDELPRRQRYQALNALNQIATMVAGLIVTCRDAEYAEAVAAADDLVRAAVVRALPVVPADAIAYLAKRRHRGTSSERWVAVFDAIVAGDQPIAGALSRPLTIALAAQVYHFRGSDPRELLDTDQFPDPRSIQRQLLSHLLLAAAASAAVTRRGWTPDRFQRWLATIAVHLHESRKSEFCWWELYRRSPALATGPRRAAAMSAVVLAAGSVVYGIATGMRHGLRYGIGHGLGHGAAYAAAVFVTSLLLPRLGSMRLGSPRRVGIISVASGLCYAIPQGTMTTLSYGLTSGLQQGIGYGLIAGLAFGVGSVFAGVLAPPAEPTRTDLRIAGRRADFARTVGTTSLNGIAFGLAVGVLTESIRNLAGAGFSDVPAGIWSGLIFGLGFGLAAGLVRWAGKPLDPAAATTPLSSLRADRELTLLRAALLAATVAAAFVLASAMTLDRGIGAGFLRLGGLEGGIMSWIIAVFSGTWPLYLIARIRLALADRLPWRMGTFLDVAHRARLLRQVGAGYQFRHVLFQEHLLEQPESTRAAVLPATGRLG